MTDPATSVDVRADCPGWRAFDCEALARRCFDAAEAAEGTLKRPLCVLFTDNAAVAKLNAQYRGQDRPTNVLSFSPGDGLWPGHAYLGDIALAFETCRDEAAAKNISLERHAAHLLVHGMLHLIGYDHETDEQAAVMERREAAILAGLGVADPYEPPLERKA